MDIEEATRRMPRVLVDTVLGVSPGLILTLNMATSRSTSGPEPRLHCQQLFLFGSGRLTVLGRQPDY